MYNILKRIRNLVVTWCLFWITVPPHQLLIYQNSGRDVNTSVVGPLTEGSDLVLTCEVRGGKLQATIYQHRFMFMWLI